MRIAWEGRYACVLWLKKTKVRTLSFGLAGAMPIPKKVEYPLLALYDGPLAGQLISLQELQTGNTNPYGSWSPTVISPQDVQDLIRLAQDYSTYCSTKVAE